MPLTKFRFNGSNNTRLGRHGIINNGDCVYLDEVELRSVANNSNFTQIDATASDQRLVEVVFSSIGIAVPGTNKQSIVLPYTLYLTAVQAFVDYPQAVAVVVDINKNGTSVLSTKLTVDASETSSETAAVAPVISDPVLPSGATISIDIDSAPLATDPAVAGGLRVVLVGTSPDARIRVTEATAAPDKVMLKT